MKNTDGLVVNKNTVVLIDFEYSVYRIYATSVIFSFFAILVL
ncbi:hypothetical protein LEP1GSC021_2749 [Leptospira noguchii str. 1993005606]|uniref:Uncharacterized protein n=1 Tax=Leptospira noguchii serovar Panama str. CZ214 TaxID=1001595 RepID=T0FNY0_9LEPT|nr:hypothetical protein LEP1GSC021_2749 [Leptospira noguchii str. 1993005606]EQA71220.1 hypothetical protein LEP1GSC059_2991 [Leptospira noguchii serovar Panama str. CZ214]